MANGVFLYAKGKFAEKASLPFGTDAVMVILLQSAGLVADTTLKNYQTLAALLVANTEATFTNYVRKAGTGLTVTPNTGTGIQTFDMNDVTWSAAGGALNNTLGKIITAYRQTSSALDSQMLPLTYHDFTATTTGGDLFAQFASTGVATAT